MRFFIVCDTSCKHESIFTIPFNITFYFSSFLVTLQCSKKIVSSKSAFPLLLSSPIHYPRLSCSVPGYSALSFMHILIRIPTLNVAVICALTIFTYVRCGHFKAVSAHDDGNKRSVPHENAITFGVFFRCKISQRETKCYEHWVIPPEISYSGHVRILPFHL